MKLIPKYQNPSGPITYNGPQFYEVEEQLKKEYPQVYNRLQIESARSQSPNSEVVHYTDDKGKPQTATSVIGMSGTDPIGELYVAGVATDPIFRWAGNKLWYGLGKTGNRWVRSKILSSQIDQSVFKGLTNEGQHQLLNNNMLKELDFFGPHKVRHFPNTVGDTYKGYVKGISTNTPIDKLSLDNTYTIANYSMGDRGTSFIHGTSPKNKLIHIDASGPQPVDNVGFLPKTKGYAEVDASKGEVPEIWWNRNTPYYPQELSKHGRVIVTSQEALEKAGLFLRGTKGITSKVLHNPGRVPFNKIEFGLEPNELGWYNRVIYTGNTPNITKNKISLKMLERPSKLSSKELLGIPKGERNNVIKVNPMANTRKTDTNLLLINRNYQIPDFSNGFAYWKYPEASKYLKPDTDKYAERLRFTNHWTTDQPVIPHNAGSWDDAPNTMLYSYKQAVKDNGFPINIEPMDTYWASSNNFKLDPKGIKILTGDKQQYLKLKQQGIDVTYSPESAKAIADKDFKLNAQIHKNWAKNQGSNPSLSDYKQMEKETGLYSNVYDANSGVGDVNNSLQINYYHAPATHSNTWLGQSEVDPKNYYNYFIDQLLNYPEYITEEQLPVLQRFVQLFGTPNKQIPFQHPLQEKINQILNGKRLYQYKKGGKL